jgi:peptide deformylase
MLPLVTAPDSRLKQISLPLQSITKNTQKFMDSMLKAMYRENGVGLAAVQVGVLKRILVIDMRDYDQLSRPENFYPLFIVNPKIIEKSQELVTAEEGCLSLPEQRVEVSRPESIKIKYLDYHNEQRELEANDWLARVIQHEYDHLEGKLTIDYLSSLKRNVVLRKLKKLKNNIV